MPCVAQTAQTSSYSYLPLPTAQLWIVLEIFCPLRPGLGWWRVRFDPPSPFLSPQGKQLRMLGTREVNKMPGMLSCLENLLVKHLRHLWEPPAHTKPATRVLPPAQTQSAGKWVEEESSPRTVKSTTKLQCISNHNKNVCQKVQWGQKHNRSITLISSVLFFITAIQLLASCRWSGETAAGKESFSTEKGKNLLPLFHDQLFWFCFDGVLVSYNYPYAQQTLQWAYFKVHRIITPRGQVPSCLHPFMLNGRIPSQETMKNSWYKIVSL